MADLLDIAPATAVEAVKLSSGERLVVRGLNGNAIASIAARFPALVMLLGGGDNIVPRLIGQFGTAIGPIIAAGCGHIGDEKAEEIAGSFLPEDQLKLVMAIYRLTFPNGLAAIMESMAIMMSGALDVPKPVKVRLKPSPSASPPSSDEASLPTMQ
jgi:hypothetical protein